MQSAMALKWFTLKAKVKRAKKTPMLGSTWKMASYMRKTLPSAWLKKDPDNKDTYEKNLKAYVEKLTALDKEAKEKFNNIPEEKKMIVTSEGCFKYFSKAYNVPSAYIWEINTEEEGTPDQIKTLVEKLRKTKVHLSLSNQV